MGEVAAEGHVCPPPPWTLEVLNLGRTRVDSWLPRWVVLILLPPPPPKKKQGKVTCFGATNVTGPEQPDKVRPALDGPWRSLVSGSFSERKKLSGHLVPRFRDRAGFLEA